MKGFWTMRKILTSIALAALGLGLVPATVAAQMTEIDPNTAIDADLDAKSAPKAEAPATATMPYDVDSDLAGVLGEAATTGSDTAAQTADAGAAGAAGAAAAGAIPATYKKDDLIGAAEGVFGKGAEGLAKMIEGILKDQGEPNAYIVGREAGGAVVLGVRYGSGTLHHKIEGERAAYWTGPSVGFDLGANAAKTFVLVYNLYDSEDLYKRYPAGEGAAYLLGGFNASYLRRGDVVLIPIRVGVGARLGANVGYMKFRKKQSWVPF
jgi:hypothetical protein